MPTTPTIPMPDVDWWADKGFPAVMILVAIGVALILLGFGLWLARDYWTTRKPHYVARWQAETEKETNAAKLFSVLSEVEPQKVATLRKLEESVEQIHRRQQDHAHDCHQQTTKIDQIHAKVVTGH